MKVKYLVFILLFYAGTAFGESWSAIFGDGTGATLMDTDCTLVQQVKDLEKLGGKAAGNAVVHRKKGEVKGCWATDGKNVVILTKDKSAYMIPVEYFGKDQKE